MEITKCTSETIASPKNSSEILLNNYDNECTEFLTLNEVNESNSLDNENTSVTSQACIPSTEIEKDSLTQQSNEITSTIEDSSSNSDINGPLTEDLDPKLEDEWLDIMGSGNFKKKILKPGLGHDTRPDRGDMITASIVFYLHEVVIEENENLQFIVGDLDVIQGLDLVVCLMENGEKAKVIIPSKLAYGKLGRSPDIPPDSDLECDIEIKAVENMDATNLSLSRRLSLGNEKRTRGNFFYERGEYVDAIHCYERATEYLEGIRDCSGTTDEVSQEIVNVKIKVYNNTAASHLKLSAYDSALKSVENVLKVQPQNVKALFRKAKILSAKGDTDEAISCIRIAIKLEPDTKVLQSELLKLLSKKKQEDYSQRIMYRRMFPQSIPKKSNLSFSNMIKWTAVTGGVVAVAFALAAYKQFHL